MDEVFYIGESKCPRCGGKDKAELFAGEVTALHDHLQAKGRRLWIWSDRLLDGKASGLGEWEASANGTARAIDLIPKDVVLCDWHYEQDVPTAPYLAMKGFHVVTCPVEIVQTGRVAGRGHGPVAEPLAEGVEARFEGVMQTVWSGTGSFLKRITIANRTRPTRGIASRRCSTRSKNCSGNPNEAVFVSPSGARPWLSMCAGPPVNRPRTLCPRCKPAGGRRWTNRASRRPNGASK
jgi:hypothetical protein